MSERSIALVATVSEQGRQSGYAVQFNMDENLSEVGSLLNCAKSSKDVFREQSVTRQFVHDQTGRGVSSR